MYSRLSKLGVVLGIILALAFVGAASAQGQITLSSPTSPSLGTPGVTSINVTGSGFPAGTIAPASVTVTLTPAAGGAPTQTAATAITTIVGATRRVTFLIPASISVSVTTPYLVSISGKTSTGTSFSSSNSASLNIAATQSSPTLTSITVTPVNPSVAAGLTQQFAATGNYSDGSTKNLTSTATWASSSTATATINSSGLATAVKTGTTTISAASGSITGTTTLTVTAAALVSIAVTPVNPSVAAGKTQQFTATGTYTDGSTQNLTSTATWASSSTTTATISATGLASALKAGTTTISATSGGITGSTTLTVTAATLTSITVTPVNPSVAAGGTQQFTATGNYSDGSTQNLTSTATWASSSTTTATISATGLASALKAGTTTISATSGGITGSTTLTVTAATLTSITVTPTNPSVAAGGTQQFTATGNYSDGSTQNLTSTATWASSSTTTATISATGLASALKAGTTTISATSGGQTGSTTLTVTAATLTSITVTPTNPSVAAGGTQQFTATGNYSDGSTQNLTSTATWASSSTTTATISATGLASALKAGTTTISATSGGQTGSTTLTVTAATLTSITVTPVNPSVAAGGTQQFTATGNYSDGSTQNLTSTATWASSSTTTATISATGLASALKAGTTTISATSGGITGSTTLTVTAATLTSITVTPVNPSVAAGGTQQFTATGNYSDGSTQNLTSTATWASSSTTTATISATGLASALKAGTTTISATSGGQTGSTTLTVTAATLTSITVTPVNPSVAAGGTQQFTATGNYSDGSTQNLTSTATWASSSTTTATISATGLASALKAGTTTISATSGGITGSTTLTVTAATLTSITVTPVNPSVAAGGTQQFTATGNYSDGSTQNLTSTATWASSSTTTATISATGLASALKAGTTTISATSGGITGSTTLTVTAATLTSITVTPVNPSVAAGGTQQFTATGNYSDGSTQNLTSTATWASSSTTTATISATGLASALKAGTTTISATSGGQTGSTTLTVTAATLTSITVTPANPAVTAGATQQFTATGNYSDGSTQNLTSTATWASSNITIATINTTGLATTLKAGTTTISATSGGITGSTTLTVTAATLTSITVTPTNPSVAAGGTQQFTATGNYSDGSTQNLTSTATWASSSTTTATISATGLASALKAGTTTISATSGGITGSTTLTVTAATLTSITVTPTNPSVAAGGTQQFTATGNYSDGSTQNLTSTATWASSSTTTATISATGLASALKAGTTTISATSGAITGSTALTVTAATLTSITVTPANPSIAAGLTQQFTATGNYSDGSTQNLTGSATWASSSTTTATINPAGLATSLKVGTTTISATSGAITGSTTLTVTAATLTSIAVTPVNPSVAAGKTQQFTATGTYTDGSTQNLTSTATWASSSTTTATINAAGLATSLKVGTTTISATNGAISGSTTLTVTAATLTSIAVTPANPSVAAGLTQQFTATGTYSDGSTQNLTATATWASSSTTTATINAAGLATTLKVGTTTISATSGAVNGSTLLTVTAATLSSIAVTPANPSVAAGLTQQFTATGTYTDGSTQNLTATATWASLSTTTATINAAGLATAVKVGTSTISATSGGISGSTLLTVTAATLKSIAVTPANPSAAAGNAVQFTATGTYSDNSTQNITASVTWTSGTTTTATINAAGLASALKVGTSTITATSGAITGNTTLTVTAATLVSIAVTPANPSVAVGSTQQFSATGTYSDGSTQNLSVSVTWASSSTVTATINTTGLATGVKVGSTTISATSGAIVGSTTLTVSATPLQITTTSLPNGQINVAYSATLAATGGTPPYTWGVTGGAFPAGVTLNPSTGVISGTPTASGAFTVTVGLNDSGTPVQTTSASYNFTISTAATITSASPSTGNQADISDNIVLTGQFTHFAQGTTTVSFGSTDITVNSVTVNNSTSVTANISISATALIGGRTVTVTTGTEVATGTNVFSVQAGQPSVVLNPNFGVEGTNPTINITGTFTHFTQGTTVANFGSSDIVAGVVTVNSPTQATVQLQIAVAAGVGARGITIVTGTEIANGSFTVTKGVPAITSLTPNAGGQNTTIPVVINGNFTSWVNGTSQANFGSGIAVGGAAAGAYGPVTVASATQLTANISIASGATLGPRNVSVQTGAELETAGGAFTVENCSTTPASVLYTSPVYNATGIPLNTQVQWQFNAPLDRTTVNSTSVYLHDQSTGQTIPATVSVDPTGRIVTLTPSQLLGVGRLYDAYLGYAATVKDACGNALAAYTTFTVTFNPTTSGPTLLQTSPAANTTAVPLNAQVVLQFSTPLDPLTLQNGITVTQGGTTVLGTFAPLAGYTNDYTRIAFTPGTTLSAGLAYTVTYTSQLTDVVGNPLQNPGSFNFTTGTTSVTTSGAVTITAPTYNETNVGTNVNPVFHFNTVVDPISFSNTNLIIVDNNTGRMVPITYTVSADRLSVTLSPVSPLQPGTQYYAEIGYNPNDLDLTGLYIQNYYFYFTTAGSSITVGPTVTAISPSNATTGAPVNTKVVAVMSGALDPNSVGNSSITVKVHSTSAVVAGTVALATDQVTMTWTPTANLSVSTQYDVTVSGVTDVQGNTSTPFTSSFTTSSSGTVIAQGALTVLSVSPASSATGVSNTSQIVLTFSESVNPETVTGISVTDQTTGGYPLSGTWAVTGAVATFTPAQPYPANANIQVYTQCVVQDFAGTHDACFLSTFTVGATADTTHPTVTSITPTSGATGIGRNTVVVLTFSKSLNPGTVTSANIAAFNGDAQLGGSPTISGNGRTVTYNAGTLPVNSVITINVSPNVTDIPGNSVVSNGGSTQGFQSSFTTSADISNTAPYVATMRPATGATDVPATTLITLFINGAPLNASTVNSSTVHVSHNGVLIDGTINLTGNNQAIEFVPSQNFNNGDLVQVFLSSNILDQNANALTAYSGQFTIKGSSATTQPQVIATNPTSGSTGTTNNPVVQVEFDQTMLASTINATNVTLYDSSSGLNIPGTVTLTGPANNVVQFVPTSTLPASTTFYLQFANVVNNGGLPLTNGYYVYFGTGSTTDTTPPTILQISPINGTSGVGVNASVLVQFSEPIDLVSISSNTIQLTGASQTVQFLSGTLDATHTFVYLYPQAPLPASTLMTLTVNGVTDISGNAVTPKTITFTTGAGADLTPPNVISFNPAVNSTGVPTNTAILVQYDKQMNTATICDQPCGYTFLYDNVSGVHVAGTTTFSTDLKSFTFVPSAPLAVDRSYTIYSYYALDLTGNQQSAATSSFTTSYTTSSTVPAVVAVNPVTTVTAVPVNVVSQVLFNEPIRPESIANVQLLQGSTVVPVTATLSGTSNVVNLTPQALLLPFTVYTISASGVQDFAGHTQTAAFTSTFTTGATFDVTATSVAGTDPVYNQVGVGTNTQFRLFFAKRANPVPLMTLSYSLVNATTGTPTPVSFTSLSADGLTAVFTPGAALLSNTQYYFDWPTLTDVTGNSIYGSYVYFTTGAGSITAGPTIVSVSPVSGATGTPVNTQVIAVASAEVDPITVTNSTFTVKQGSTVIPGTVTLANDLVTMTWAPTTNLATSTTFTVSINGVQDSEGNLLTAFTSTFATGSSSTPVGAGSLIANTITPVNGAVGQSNTVPIVFTFSEAINPATTSNILVRDVSNSYYPIPGTWVVSGAVATFTPAEPYPANSTIQAYTQCQVRDYAGNNDNCSSTQFTIANVADTLAFKVTSVTPTAGSTNVGLNSRIAVTFSKSVNQTTVTSGTLGVLSGDSIVGLGLAFSPDGRTVTFGTSNLTPATTYTIAATSAIQDLSGNALPYFQSQFTTGPVLLAQGPSVVTQRPANGATNVALNTTITLFTNNTPLNPSTVSTNSVHVSQNGVLVPGTVTTTGNNQAIVFTPTANLAPGVVVQIYVDQTVTDTNSVPLSAAYSGQFTSVPALSTVAPVLIAYSPAYGVTGSPTNVIPQLQFNQPLLSSTINATNVYLYNGTTGTNVGGTVSLIGPNSDTIQFQPSAALPANTYFYLYVTNVTSVAGGAIPNSYYIYFQTGSATDATTPTVTTVGPPNGVTGVGTNASIILTFSKAIDSVSINGTTVKVTGGSQTVIPTNLAFGRYSVVSPYFDYVQITPESPLPANSVMTIAVNGVTDLEGHAVPTQSTTFTTGAGPNVSTPTIIYSSFQSGDTVPTNAAFTIEWDRQMDPGTINSSNFYLSDNYVGSLASVETVTVSSDLRRGTITVPGGTLVTGHSISINSYGAQDISGNTENGFSYAATVGATPDTTPPVVLETNPPASLTGVPLNVPIQIEFSKEISETSVGNVQLLLGSTPVVVSTSFTRGANVLVLTPTVPLLPSTSYTISITGVTDITGNVFVGTQTQTFTTGASVKIAAPVNISVTPCCNVTGVADNSTIQLVFDSPMDPLTFDTFVGAAKLTLTSTGATVATTVNFSADFKTITLKPSVNLTSGTSYTVVLAFGYAASTYVTDMAGNAYSTGITTSFTAQ